MNCPDCEREVYGKRCRCGWVFVPPKPEVKPVRIKPSYQPEKWNPNDQHMIRGLSLQSEKALRKIKGLPPEMLEAALFLKKKRSRTEEVDGPEPTFDILGRVKR